MDGQAAELPLGGFSVVQEGCSATPWKAPDDAKNTDRGWVKVRRSRTSVGQRCERGPRLKGQGELALETAAATALA